jgi:hypothetical protein
LNRLPGTAAEIERKANELRIATKMYRAAYRAAFGKTAFKPSTHIGKHLSEHQTRLQYDIKDYSAEAQEHQGKIMKGFTKKQNGRQTRMVSRAPATYSSRRRHVWGSDLTQIRRWTQTQAPSAPRAAIRCFFSSSRQVLSGDALSTKEMASLQRLSLRCQSRSRNELSEFAWYTAPSGALFCI